MISTGTYARRLHIYTDLHTQAVTQHNIYDMCGKGTTDASDGQYIMLKYDIMTHLNEFLMLFLVFERKHFPH